MTKSEENILMSKEELNEQTEYHTTLVMKVLANLIRKARLEKGLSFRNIYDATNVSVALLSDFEQHKKNPKLETIIRLAIYLGLDMEKVFGEYIFPKYSQQQKSSNKKLDDKDIVNNLLLSQGYSQEHCTEILEFMRFVKCKQNLK